MQSVKLVLLVSCLAVTIGCGSSGDSAGESSSPAADVSKAGAAGSNDSVEGKGGGRAAESSDPNIPAGR